MSVRVRMAPSPTGFLHIGGVRTFLFNWLFARRHGGEILLRIENTDTSREVADATEQIQSSLRWLGIDWDGPVPFQLDTADRARELARELVAAGTPTRTRARSASGSRARARVSWDDAVRGRIEFQNDQLSDLVIVRSDGRPTYNFVSPGRRHAGRDHARDSRRGPRLEHALADQHPARARRRSPRVRARAEHPRRATAGSSRSDGRRSRSTTSARRVTTRRR